MRPTARHFLSLRDLSREELLGLLEHASKLKREGVAEPLPLRGKTLGMVFRKPSTRTRVSFEAGMFQLGGHALFLPAEGTHLGRREHGESLSDTAKVLSRYLDGLMIRTFDQEEAEELAEHASIPVVNGLTDLLHPCQLLADLLTVREEFGSELEKLTVAWIGDGNNMANSWINAAGLLGFTLRIAGPEGYEPDPEILSRAQTEADVRLLRDPLEAVRGADVVCTDTWASMGQEGDSEARALEFARYQVTASLFGEASSEAIFLHCLPAHRGAEVTPEVIDGSQSRVFDEAENRLHVQKALLIELMS